MTRRIYERVPTTNTVQRWSRHWYGDTYDHRCRTGQPTLTPVKTLVLFSRVAVGARGKPRGQGVPAAGLRFARPGGPARFAELERCVVLRTAKRPRRRPAAAGWACDVGSAEASLKAGVRRRSEVRLPRSARGPAHGLDGTVSDRGGTPSAAKPQSCDHRSSAATTSARHSRSRGSRPCGASTKAARMGLPTWTE
jgi:hypothetical protein